MFYWQFSERLLTQRSAADDWQELMAQVNTVTSVMGIRYSLLYHIHENMHLSV